jgi:NADH-quinone oxidoreductase subunit L
MGNVIDMRRFGGLRTVMPRTHIGFLCGAVALAGIPIFSGFWSKDEILAGAWNASQEAQAYRPLYLLIFLFGMITAFLTAFYTFRAYYMTFHGEVRVPPEALEHAHHGHQGHGEEHGTAHGHPPGPSQPVDVHHLPPLESPPVMTIPLMILSVFALFVGLALGPTHLFGGFVEHTPGLPANAEYFSPVLMVISSLLAIGGWGLAHLMYKRQPDLPGRLAASAQGLYQLSLNKFHVDELYEALLLKPLSGLTVFTRIFDLNVLDSFVDLCGHVPRLFGYLFRPLQNGLVQFYALTMILALTIFLFVLAAKTW